MKKYVDILIEKTYANGKEVEEDYWNKLFDEIAEWLRSEHSKEDEEKLYKEALIEVVFMCSDYSDF